MISGDNGYIEINTRAKRLHPVALEMIDGGNADSRGCLVSNRLVWSEVTKFLHCSNKAQYCF